MEVFANNYLSEPNYSGIIPDTTDIHELRNKSSVY